MMSKEQYIQAITELLQECEDFQLIDMIYKLLHKLV